MLNFNDKKFFSISEKIEKGISFKKKKDYLFELKLMFIPFQFSTSFFLLIILVMVILSLFIYQLPIWMIILLVFIGTLILILSVDQIIKRIRFRVNYKGRYEQLIKELEKEIDETEKKIQSVISKKKYFITESFNSVLVNNGVKEEELVCISKKMLLFLEELALEKTEDVIII